jgi:hypothetical protein
MTGNYRPGPPGYGQVRTMPISAGPLPATPSTLPATCPPRRPEPARSRLRRQAAWGGIRGVTALCGLWAVGMPGLRSLLAWGMALTERTGREDRPCQVPVGSRCRSVR